MIINRKAAEQAWEILRGQARVADEAWDAPAMTSLNAVTDSTLKDAYRIGARYTHPDTGGSLEAFARIDRAKHVLVAWLKQSPEPAGRAMGGPCETCNGTGFVRRQRGFRAMRMQCITCNGSGDKDYDRDNLSE